MRDLRLKHEAAVCKVSAIVRRSLLCKQRSSLFSRPPEAFDGSFASSLEGRRFREGEGYVSKVVFRLGDNLALFCLPLDTDEAAFKAIEASKPFAWKARFLLPLIIRCRLGRNIMK